ncbi:MAG: hypothetical protein GY832_07865 [Chloroflexi bacterium]|nr:hypothetical protein [Chloroflexota bacterium]
MRDCCRARCLFFHKCLGYFCVLAT